MSVNIVTKGLKGRYPVASFLHFECLAAFLFNVFFDIFLVYFKPGFKHENDVSFGYAFIFSYRYFEIGCAMGSVICRK